MGGKGWYEPTNLDESRTTVLRGPPLPPKQRSQYRPGGVGTANARLEAVLRLQLAQGTQAAGRSCGRFFDSMHQDSREIGTDSSNWTPSAQPQKAGSRKEREKL
jgi:hypothetical protein